MNLLQTLAIGCTEEVKTILGLVNMILDLVRWVIPAILIVLAVFDIAKVVMNASLDDKVKKEATSKLTTRVIYAIVIFLIPTIVSILFQWIKLPGTDASIIDCMNKARETQ